MPDEQPAGLGNILTIVCGDKTEKVELGEPQPYNPNRKYWVPVTIEYADGTKTTTEGGFIE